MTQSDIAQAVGISRSRLCEFFNGTEVPKKAALKMQEFTGHDFTDFMTMPPADLRAVLEAAYLAAHPAQGEAPEAVNG